MIALPYGEKNGDDMLSRFHLIPERNGQTDKRTDGRTDGQICYINIAIKKRNTRRTRRTEGCEIARIRVLFSRKHATQLEKKSGSYH